MARFYVGQPVVSIWSKEQWIAGARFEFECFGCAIPDKNVRYTVIEYCRDQGADNHIHVSELSDPWRTWYSETGFAPITDEQVKDIISTAIDIPDAVRKRELEPI